ncbi:hypothetical protein [Saccharopolyspora hattusasensis]|uniref:hypothetical protein n=1 Tax=Saccharopolyspora hattusasensis TaxID=1128679 RepID=UPI003D973A7B
MTDQQLTPMEAATMLADPRNRADHDLVEQDNRAWLALPGRSCIGGDWNPCTEPGAWQLRGYAERAFCTRHAATRLRIADQLAAGPGPVSEFKTAGGWDIAEGRVEYNWARDTFKAIEPAGIETFHAFAKVAETHLELVAQARKVDAERAAEQLTPEQIAYRHALAARLHTAREHAKTVHPGQYGVSLGRLLAFLAHHLDDPAHPLLGLMPRHAERVADHLAAQAERAAGAGDAQ